MCCGVPQGGREGLTRGLSGRLGGFIRVSDSVCWRIFGVLTYVYTLVLYVEEHLMEVVEFTVEGSEDVSKVPPSSNLCDMTINACLILQYLTPSRQSHNCLRCFGYLSNSASFS